MKKLSLFTVLFLPVFLAVFSVQAGATEFSLRARYRTPNVNIVEGSLFNDYWVTHLELEFNVEWKKSGIEVFASPYTYFRTTKPSEYMEHGLLIGVKKNLWIFDLTAKSMLVTWKEEGERVSGYVLFGELELDAFLNPKVVYASSNITGMDLNGNSLRLDFGHSWKIRHKGKKLGVVELRKGLIYNRGFFRERKGIVFTSDILLKEVKLFGPLSVELFINWFYAKDVINKLMIGLNVDFRIIGKED